ncbi:hypothetical protein CMI47_00870 [Candidatus Pacearchaeota archaeon]|nr:hypothetical protein [Candidatus Pacearchaeota archaeon]
MTKSSSHPFTRWLLEQEHRNDPVGDLARDAKLDKDWPSCPGSLDLFRGHLIRRGGGSEVRHALGSAWTEFLLGSV